MGHLNRVSIETVIQGSNEEPIEFNCRSMVEAKRLTKVLKAAPEMLEVLEFILPALNANMDESEPEMQRLLAVIAKARSGTK